MIELTGKKALVTGATSGIGKATALALAATGAIVAVSGRDKEKGQAVVDAIEASGGSAVFVAGDLIDADAALDLAARATEALGGRVDILVNSAGTFPFGPTASHDEATFDAVYTLNVKAPWFLVAALAPSMAERGSGAIVNVSTMVAQFGMDGMALWLEQGGVGAAHQGVVGRVRAQRRPGERGQPWPYPDRGDCRHGRGPRPAGLVGPRRTPG